MRPLCVLIVPLQKLPEIAIREGLSTSLRTGGREFSPTANNNPLPLIYWRIIIGNQALS